MKAVKGNKEYTVTEENKALYAAQGFDIIDEDGKVIQYGKGKTVGYEEYEKLRAAHTALMQEYEKLRAENAELKKETAKPAKKAGG